MTTNSKFNNSLPLKFLGSDIVFQEVPNEISLAINVSGCPHRCEGCHSQYLWQYAGEYLFENFQDLLNKYKDYITCVCFMGGEQNMREICLLADIVKKFGLKSAIYSGEDNTDKVKELFQHFDYIKLGHYNKNKGGLNNPLTNQRMYKKTKNEWEDITSAFWKPWRIS